MGEIIFVKYWEDSDNKLVQWTYTLPNFKSITYDMNTPVSPMPMPEEDASENILVKIEGNSSKLTVNWVIKDMGTVTTVTETPKPPSPQTDPPTVPQAVVYPASSTIRDQVEWFKSIFRPSSVASNYELIVRFDPLDASKDLVFPGTFSGFNFSMMTPSILTFNASAKFMEGTVASMYEVDTASAPKNLALTVTTVSGKKVLNASWDAPDDSGAAAINTYRVSYRRWASGSGWSTAFTTGTSPVPTLLNNIASPVELPTATYEVYVEAFTVGLGFGRSSYKKSIALEQV